MKKNILILGGLGFIGVHLIKELLKDEGNDIFVLDNLSSDIENYPDRIKQLGLTLKLLKKDATILVGKHLKIEIIDISDECKVDVIFKENNFDIIINLAAKTGIQECENDKKQCLISNIVGFNNIINLSVKYNIKHLLYTSSSTVYGEKNNKKEKYGNIKPISFYGLSKLNNELLAETVVKAGFSEIKITGLRLFNVIGEHSRKNMAFNLFTQKIVDDKPLVLYNNGWNRRDLIYVGDLIELISKIIDSDIEYKHEIFNVGSGNTISMNGYYGLIKKTLGIEHYKLYFKRRLKNDVIKTKANIKKTEKWFNWQPKTNVKEKIKEILKKEIK